MPVKIKIDFYQVRLPDAFSGTFKEICQAVDKMTGRRRNFPLNGAIIRLHKLFDGGIVEGDLVRLRMDSLPAKGDLDGRLEDIDFEAEEGVAEQTAFLFDSNTRVLLLQRNKSGVGGNAFAAYFEEKGGVPEAIVLLPIIKAKTMQRLARFQQVRKLRIAIARPLHSSAKIADANDPVSMGRYLKTLEYLQAPRMEIEVSVGRWDDGMSMKNAMEFVRNAMGMKKADDSDVVKLLVDGKNEDDETESLDILRDRIIYQIAVEPDERRRLKYGVRRNALKKAWDESQDEVQLYADK
jgi:hypothetical protein